MVGRKRISPIPSPREEREPKKPAKARREAESPTASESQYLTTISQKMKLKSPPKTEVRIRRKALRYRGLLSLLNPKVMSLQINPFRDTSGSALSGLPN